MYTLLRNYMYGYTFFLNVKSELQSHLTVRKEVLIAALLSITIHILFDYHFKFSDGSQTKDIGYIGIASS